MKRVFTSAGILALGAASLHAYDPEMTRQQTGRPWSVAASVRGFYDDNIATSPSREEDSFGLEFRPSAHVSLPFDQTFLALGYIYSIRWYEDRSPNNVDQGHEFNAKLRHQFTPRHSVSVDETFLLSTEPTIIDRNGIITAPTRLRTKSNVIHNRGAINYQMGVSQRVAFGLGYGNEWYDYEQEGAGSRSALLDRLEQLIHADARYQFSPTLVGLIGYSFGMTTFEGNDFLLNDAARNNLQRALDGDEDTEPLTGSARLSAIRSLNLMSDDRNSISHYGYVGGHYDLTARLRASVRVGAQVTSYPELNESTANPYADASLTYTYMPGSSVEVGIRNLRNATDVSTPDSQGRPTLDAESTAVYSSVHHRITERLVGSLIGQFQTSRFNDGINGGKTEDIYLVGVNMNYAFHRNFSAEAGYNYDLLESEVEGRGYRRNRVYVGLRATY